jgi:TonB family protein
MNFSSLKYMLGSIGSVLLAISLLQACHETYRTANISTTESRTIGNKETPVNPGVFLSLQEYVLEHINYPPGAMINQVEGTVYIRFSIDNNGRVSNVAAVGTRIGYGLEEEAIRVVTAIPAPIAMAMKGKKTKRVLPVIYRIKTSVTTLSPPVI